MGNLTQTKNLLENFRENETPEKEKVNQHPLSSRRNKTNNDVTYSSGGQVNIKLAQ